MQYRIKQLRKHLKMTQAEFGAELSVAQTTIAGYENGSRLPDNSKISLICSRFGVSEQWLREGTDPMLIKRTASDELAEFTAQLQNEDSFRKRFISMLATLDPEDWAVLKKMADELAKRNEHE